MKNVNLVSGLNAELAKARSASPGAELVPTDFVGTRSATPASNGEMASRKWKILPGNVPVLSSVETGGEKKGKEL